MVNFDVSLIKIEVVRKKRDQSRYEREGLKCGKQLLPISTYNKRENVYFPKKFCIRMEYNPFIRSNQEKIKNEERVYCIIRRN